MLKSFKLPQLSIGLLLLSGSIFANEKQDFKSTIEPFLVNYCLDCHDSDVSKGDVELHELEDVTVKNADMWIRVWEQVALKAMPPREKEKAPKPSLMKRLEVSNWITAQLEETMKDHGGFSSHHRPAKGNHIDHDLLFGELPKNLEPTSSPARIWRIHPQEHLTRLNELINKSPEYSADSPGKRSHGDAIPYDKYGDYKIYYSLDRIVGHIGGYVAYETAVQSFPSVLTTVTDHGLKNYPFLYSVNGSEAAQISSLAKNIIHYMAFGPEALPHQFVDSMKGVDKKHLDPTLRGLPQSLFYKKEMTRPITPVYELLKDSNVTDLEIKNAVTYLYKALTFKSPSKQELSNYITIVKDTIKELGYKDGAVLGLTSIFLDRDALFRAELAEYGKPDKYGRVMLQGEELALTINSSLRYLTPDQPLNDALKAGKLKTKEDVKKQVSRILEDDSIKKPKVLKFFKEYFDYEHAAEICKDEKALASAGGSNADSAGIKKHSSAVLSMIRGTDRLIELILEEDKDVLKELLTTNRQVISPTSDWRYFSKFDVEKEDVIKRELEIKAYNEAYAKDKKKKKKKKWKALSPPKAFLDSLNLPGKKVNTKPYKGTETKTLTTLPKNERMGILTQPSWLIAHSDAMDNHAILRGKWVRERLLGDSIPDVPITVDAMLPVEDTPLRHRMRVTREEECWRCHQKMDPLGLPFEMFNHIGRVVEMDHGKKADTSGEIIYSGEAGLDGPVKNAIDLIQKLSESKRVEQVFIRHAFRYWIGRNETLNDAPVLQKAHQDYQKSGGSMKALILSLLTSDAFLYRKVDPKQI